MFMFRNWEDKGESDHLKSLHTVSRNLWEVFVSPKGREVVGDRSQTWTKINRGMASPAPTQKHTLLLHSFTESYTNTQASLRITPNITRFYKRAGELMRLHEHNVNRDEKFPHCDWHCSHLAQQNPELSTWFFLRCSSTNEWCRISHFPLRRRSGPLTAPGSSWGAFSTLACSAINKISHELWSRKWLRWCNRATLIRFVAPSSGGRRNCSNTQTKRKEKRNLY